MFCRRSIVGKGLMIGLAMVGTAALADGELEAEKEAPLQRLFPNSYGGLELRHYTDVYMNGDKTKDIEPQMQARYQLGSTFFDERLDSMLELGAMKKADTDQVTQMRPVWYNTVTALETDWFRVAPFVYSYLPVTNQEPAKSYDHTDFEAGAEVMLSREFLTAQGIISLEAGLNHYQNLSTQQGETAVEGADDNNATSLTLSKRETGYTTKAEAAKITNEHIVAVGFTPNALPGLKLEVGTEVERTFNPAKKVASDGSSVEDAGYKTANVTENHYTVAYDISDSVTLKNTLYHYFDGVYEARSDDKRFINLTEMVVALF